MIPILAQSTPDANALKSFLEVFFYLAGSGVALLVGVRTIWPKAVPEVPQPLTVKEQKRFATWEELQNVREEVRAIGNRFDEAVAQIRRDGEGRVAGIEQHIDGLKGEIKGDNSELHERITELLTSFSELKGAVRAKLSF